MKTQSHSRGDGPLKMDLGFRNSQFINVASLSLKVFQKLAGLKNSFCCRFPILLILIQCFICR